MGWGGGSGGIKHQTLRCSRLVRKRRIAFPSAQMESDIWERGKIQLEAGVFLHVCRKKRSASTKDARDTACCEQAQSRVVVCVFCILWRKYYVHLQLVKIYEIRSPEVTVIVRYSKGEEGRGKNQLSAISSRLYGFIMIT